MRRRSLVLSIAIVQVVLFLAHILLYQTWTFRLTGVSSLETTSIKLILGILSISFVAASVLAFSYTNAAVRMFYKASAIWMGFLSFLFSAALLAWLVFGITSFGVSIDFHRTVQVLFSVAMAFSIYGLINASWTRITRISVRLANLPDTWRGRKAALV